MSLGNVGPNAIAAIPVLVEAAREESVWNIAADALVKTGETNLALSLVAERLKHAKKQIRMNAAMFVVCYDPTHSLAISNLVEFAQDASWGRVAIQQLAKLRPVPESAVPVLRRMAASQDHPFRREAENALRTIQAGVADTGEERF